MQDFGRGADPVCICYGNNEAQRSTTFKQKEEREEEPGKARETLAQDLPTASRTGMRSPSRPLIPDVDEVATVTLPKNMIRPGDMRRRLEAIGSR
jgi:hypothetical protein